MDMRLYLRNTLVDSEQSCYNKYDLRAQESLRSVSLDSKRHTELNDT